MSSIVFNDGVFNVVNEGSRDLPMWEVIADRDVSAIDKKGITG